MIAPLASNPYSQQQHSMKFPFTSAPQRPPSPPGEESTKCSLPSISSLLDYADSSPKIGIDHRAERASSHPPSGYAGHDLRSLKAEPTSGPFGRGYAPRVTLPPTPPMQPDAGDGAQSPSAASQRSSCSAPAPFPGPSSLEGLCQRPLAGIGINTHRQSAPPSNMSVTSSPGQNSPASFCSPINLPAAKVSLPYQRPLPQAFPPTTVPISVAPSSGTYPGQHHHYISPSSQATFPQSQDRYICQTCNKAFSRPSSLRIHSHSHTGEKPFKCPHHGCGKAFSVRSNMKRHERGCHPSGSPSSV